jgi:excisionase family DNA binding protein
MGEGSIPGGEGQGQSDTSRSLTVDQAADALGVTVDAIRSRIKRGTIDHTRVGGRVYVILGDDQGATNKDQHIDQGSDQAADHSTNVGSDPRDELLEELRSRVRALEEANRENRRLLAAALERIPAIEPPETPGASESDEGEHFGTSRQEAEESLHEPSQRRSWLYRFFFGP